ncbi:hypothetical protein GQ42DRAFT_3284 [Ramicandelaber brevisporus]|nr:hypothetical protein GQ42DRAFT_3284 [Ramicandelaber brevisporus]
MFFDKIVTESKRSWLSFASRFRHHDHIEQQEHQQHSEQEEQEEHQEHADTTTTTTTITTITTTTTTTAAAAAAAAATVTTSTSDRLFVMTYDLLELIATTYFERHEAAKALCVNSQFHEAFSRAVWRHLSFYSPMCSVISKATWKNYGHLVRVLDIERCKRKTEIDDILLPNLIELKMKYFQLLQSDVGYAKFPKLRRLQLTLVPDKSTRSDTIQCVDLAQRWIQQSKYSLRVHWVTDVMPVSSQNDMITIDDILSEIGVDSIAHHTFSVTLYAKYPVNLVQLPMLAGSLTKLHIDYSIPVLDCFFNSKNNTVYPRLKSLSVSNSTLSPLEPQQRISNLAPNWLPSLMELTIATDLGFHSQGWFVGIFEHTWATLTTVHFYRCYSAMDFQAAISYKPNLLNLYLLDCVFDLDIAILATCIPGLKHLSLGSGLTIDLDSLQHEQRQLKLAALKTLHLSHDYNVESDASIPKNALQFIIHGAPGLESVGFYRVKGIWESDLDNVRDMVNPAVRSLRIHVPRYILNFEMMQNMISLFPNLIFLDIDDFYGVHQTKNMLMQEYPNLTFL